MRLRIDPTRCQGHGRCASFVPELVELDDQGYAVALGDGEVPEAARARARLAIANCPELALTATEG